MYNDKYKKAQTSLPNVSFYGNRVPRENERFACLSVILLDSVVNIDKKILLDSVVNIDKKYYM